MRFYPHGTLVHFGWKKNGGPMLSACLAPQDPSLARRSRSPFFDRPGRFIFVSQIEANFEIHEFINSGWPKWCPRGSPPKRPFPKTYVILLGRGACIFCRFCWGPPVECRRGCEWTFSRWCPAGLKRVLRQFSGNPQIGVSRR